MRYDNAERSNRGFHEFREVVTLPEKIFSKYHPYSACDR